MTSLVPSPSKSLDPCSLLQSLLADFQPKAQGFQGSIYYLLSAQHGNQKQNVKNTKGSGCTAAGMQNQETASFSWEVVTRWLEINLEFSGAWEGGDRSTEMVHQGLLWLESWFHANWCCVCWCLLHNIGWGAHRVEEGEQKRFANVMVHISYLSSVRVWLSPAVVLPWNWLCPPGDIFGCYK